MGLDSDDGKGERAILAERGNYVKPLLTPRGDRIVFSTHPRQGDSSVFIVGFDGTGLRRFDRGVALGVWQTRRMAASGSTSLPIYTARLQDRHARADR